jgi:ribosomal-protein-alanine N-acetyltransferase
MNEDSKSLDGLIAAHSHMVVTSKKVSTMTTFVQSFFEIKPYYSNRQFAEFILPHGFRLAFFAAIGKTVDYFSAEGERHFSSFGVTTRCIDFLYQKTQRPEFIDMGVKVSGPPKEHPWGEKSFLMIDPDGNRWEITESPSASGMLVNRDLNGESETTDQGLRNQDQEFPKLTSTRLTLKPIFEYSAAEVIDYFKSNEEHLVATSPALPTDFYEQSYWQKRLDDERKSMRAGTKYQFGFSLKDSARELMGMITLQNVVRGSYMGASVGYSLAKDKQGHGYVAEALKEVENFAFNTLLLNKITATYLPENARSAAVLERAGYQKTGLMPSFLYINGAWRDHDSVIKINPQAVKPQV